MLKVTGNLGFVIGLPSASTNFSAGSVTVMVSLKATLAADFEKTPDTPSISKEVIASTSVISKVQLAAFPVDSEVTVKPVSIGTAVLSLALMAALSSVSSAIFPPEV